MNTDKQFYELRPIDDVEGLPDDDYILINESRTLAGKCGLTLGKWNINPFLNTLSTPTHFYKPVKTFPIKRIDEMIENARNRTDSFAKKSIKSIKVEEHKYYHGRNSEAAYWWDELRQLKKRMEEEE